MKAKLNSNSVWFPHARLLLGLYDYRLKHHAAMEEEDCDVITTLRIASLAPFFGLEESELRMTPFQEGEDDEDISTIHASSSVNRSQYNIKDINEGPLTRSRAKKLQHQVNSFLTDYNFNTSKNIILPKCSILMLLRYTHEDMEDMWPKDMVLQNGFVGKVARINDRTQKKVTRADDRTLEEKVTQTNDRTSERNSHNF